MGVMPITLNNFSSCYSISNKFFIPSSTKLNYGIRLGPTLKEVERQGTLVPYDGGCSSVVERATVARVTRVRFSPSALFRKQKKMEKRNER